MKNTILLASLVAAGTAAVIWLMKRKNYSTPIQSERNISRRSHHRTNVFANAKEK